jgi:glycerol-3-phosphate O-acyltransferase
MTPGHDIAIEAKRRVLAQARAASVEGDGRLAELLGGTVYHERQRLARHSRSGEHAEDRAFVARLHRALAHGEDPNSLLEETVGRYAHEIEGHFDPRVYAFATHVLPIAFTALLNGTTPAEALFRVPELVRLSDRVVLSGAIERLRALEHLGTIVLVPTHVSNLDSLLFGYVIHALGLPPFAYGAGLNLFGSRVLGYFMHNLGAYTIDRTKSDPLYRELLKEYSTVALERGQHQLFFPGGTRSRSFGLERRLKKGLLGTTLAAFRNRVRSGAPEGRIFIVPATCSYPLVLEASSLVEDFLHRTGRERYLPPIDEEPDRVELWLGFLRKLMALDVDLDVRIGEPLDPFGCPVDDRGRSLDPRGRPIDPSGYLRSRGEIVADPQRDAAYTEQLEERLLSAYRRDNVVRATWAVSFAAFELLRRRSPNEPVHRLVRRVHPGTPLVRSELLALLAELLGEIAALAERGGISQNEELGAGPEEVLEQGLRCFATYHGFPVLSARADAVVVGDASLLYFYRNRLEGYGLLSAPSLLPEEVS